MTMTPKPYTYLLGWKNSTFYYGVRTANKHPAKDDLLVFYFSSSQYVKDHIKEHGLPDMVSIREFDDKHDAIDWEEDFIDLIDAVKSPNWLNKANRRACCYAPESREKISRVHKGKIVSEETRKKLSDSHTGMVRSEETKAKMSIAKKKPRPQLTEEHKENVRKSLKGKTLSDEAKEKIRQKAIGRGHTEETRKKMAESRKAYWEKKRTEGEKLGKI